MVVRFLESFYGGSHREVADAIVRHSRHRVLLSTMPARFWKWRMRGASLHFVRELEGVEQCDLVVCTGLMSVADFAALRTDRRTPVLLYAHETQLSYPTTTSRNTDLHFPFTDLTNMLAADHVAFNSCTHRDAFLSALPGFLRKLPERRPMWVVDRISQRSSVCRPGIRLGSSGPARTTHGCVRTDPPLILWNHRWEFDKDPEAFFAALRTVRGRGLRFRLALLGESFQIVPKPFLAARTEFADQIVHYGYVADRHDYETWLDRADLIVSTARQENFGISVMEALAHGALPLLPRRLSYTEIIPVEWHRVLYDEGTLADRLCALLSGPRSALVPPQGLVDHARSFAWERRIVDFDRLFEEVRTSRG